MRALILVAALSVGCAGLPFSGGHMHTVARGDTLGTISKQYEVPVQEILEANPQVENKDKIEIGERLRIPASIDE